ncbi:MAG TPA: hypothetical protein VN701_01810 [Candidatus Paceibacterota bacterium]|nr:hypothetical protein [Candidatus Paceibacterota bacterium]
MTNALGRLIQQAEWSLAEATVEGGSNSQGPNERAAEELRKFLSPIYEECTKHPPTSRTNMFAYEEELVKKLISEGLILKPIAKKIAFEVIEITKIAAAA